jgi:cation diffusion facilitator CzcD-associated flavoprotein CzcO
MAEHTDVVVIGAGPAGLAVGACLRKAGLDFIILEKDHQVASSWRRHYERLHLHTVKQLSSLPYVPFPAAYPRYVPRHLVVEYLDSYAAHFDLKRGLAMQCAPYVGMELIGSSRARRLRSAPAMS